jgi:hypothetical protein
LMDAVVRRGFRGELHHVRHGSELTRIRSGETGVVCVRKPERDYRPILRAFFHRDIRERN